jgi:hypothetical protein
MWMDDVLLQIKIDYLAEIIIIRITRDDMFDPRIMNALAYTGDEGRGTLR